MTLFICAITSYIICGWLQLVRDRARGVDGPGWVRRPTLWAMIMAGALWPLRNLGERFLLEGVKAYPSVGAAVAQFFFGLIPCLIQMIQFWCCFRISQHFISNLSLEIVATILLCLLTMPLQMIAVPAALALLGLITQPFSRTSAKSISPSPKTAGVPPSQRYPAPDRSNISENPREGFRTGILKDNRPYRIESWSEDHNHFVTVFFSILGIEKASPAELLELVNPILLDPLLVPEKRRRLNKDDVHRWKDARGNEMYSLTFVVILESDDA